MIENLITVIITAIVSPVLVLIVKHLLTKKTAKNFNVTLKMIDHPTFVDIDHMRSITIRKLCIDGDENKTKMIRKFLDLKITSIENNFLTLAECVDNKRPITTNDYYKTITKIIKDYEEQAEASRIPEIFIRRFSEWHIGKVELIFETIDYVTSSSGIYDTEIERLSTVLKLISTILHLTIMDAEKVIATMNGELSTALENIEF